MGPAAPASARLQPSGSKRKWGSFAQQQSHPLLLLRLSLPQHLCLYSQGPVVQLIGLEPLLAPAGSSGESAQPSYRNALQQLSQSLASALLWCSGMCINDTNSSSRLQWRIVQHRSKPPL